MKHASGNFRNRTKKDKFKKTIVRDGKLSAKEIAFNEFLGIQGIDPAEWCAENYMTDEEMENRLRKL